MSKKVTKKTWKNFSFTSLNRSRISFDWSNRNREPIDSGRDFVMNFFKFSINREFLLIDRMFFLIDRKRIENRSSHLETSWWISLVFQLIEKYFHPIKRTIFEISLSVKTLMKCKAMCDEITHVFKIKTVLLKFLVGERFKGWISWTPLLVHSSVSRHLVLASSLAFHANGVYFIVLQDWTSRFIVVWTNSSSWP